MSSYKQWASSARKGGPARVTWVCGQERLLVSEVVGSVSNAVGADDSEVHVAGQAREKDLWAAVMAIPANGYKRLVIVREAGRLRHWGQLRLRMTDARGVMQGSYVIFDASEHDFPKDEEGKLDEPASWIRDSTIGQLIRCAPLSPEDAVQWAKGKLAGLTDEQAKHLLLRAGGDLPEVRSVLVKARMFGGRLTDQGLDLLCSELPGDFVDALLLGDRKAAMLAAENMGPEGFGYSLGLLASRLQVLSTLHRAARDNVSRRDVTARLGVPAFLAQRYAGVAREYGEERVARCWAALAAAEDAHRSGVSEGAPEILVVTWLGSAHE